ncbi:hypothetical protein CFP65_4705 [Kitasatospora sp. MMS16-BH015]|uniref:hypothetical protein n=1 Tax=Kitasatospora sp. MMS16-BH015 TaxID=2018025 RepID=UPI000CA2945C|nr:hypothetical protein [Kitasatospora sp. MMS16-BH015]AUG79431.1 hypothetical protein CFP65_4705 [Kitasatospora sp. MMS16-BH015]
MTTLFTSLIAVLGTLLGSSVTHLFQQRATRHTEARQAVERLRQERLDAYGGYAGLLVEFRQAMLHAWFSEHEQLDEADTVQLRRHSFELRTSTHQALLRLQLLVDEPTLVEAATTAFRSVGRIDRAEGREELLPRRDESQQLIDAFLRAARRQLAAT